MDDIYTALVDIFVNSGQRLLLRRNYKDPKLCPVIALMIWLAVLRYITELFICMKYFPWLWKSAWNYSYRLYSSYLCLQEEVQSRSLDSPSKFNKSSCGKPLVKEAFRKMLYQLVKSMYILPHSLHIDKSFLPLPSTFKCTLNRGWNWNSWSENT